MSKLTYKFDTGLEVTGSLEEIEKIGSSLGLKVDYRKLGDKVPRGYYPSESKGLKKISEMNESHLKRALLKRAKDYLSEVYEAGESNKKFLEKFLKLASDPIIEDIFSELQKRS